MSRITMTRVLWLLAQKFKDVEFAGGEIGLTCWIAARHKFGNWSFERRRMTSPGAAMVFAEVMLEEFDHA